VAGLRTLSVRIYEAEEDEGGYWAEVPELPGCVAQGETIQELQRNVYEAIQAWLETQHEIASEESPEPHLKAIASVVIDEDDLVPA
jgi:predicted RNase H-like HicB family nuclease